MLLFFLGIGECQWVHLVGGPDSGSISAMCTKGDTLFAARLDKLYRSDDNGASWQLIGTGLESQTLASISAIDSLLFAGSSNGIFRSRDNGDTWEKVYNELGVQTNAFIKHNGFIFAASDSVHRSSDNGMTWLTRGMNINVGPKLLSFATIGSNIFACDYFGVFRSTNEGTMWYFVNPIHNAMDASALIAIGNTLIAAPNADGVDRSKVAFYRSTNLGLKWAAIDSSISRPSVSSFAVSGKNIIAGRLGNPAVSLSSDNGLHWVSAIGGLGDTDVRALAVNSKYLFAGTFNKGVWRRDLVDFNNAVSSGSVNSSLNFELYPNPSFENAKITYTLDKRSTVKIEILNPLGQIVITLFDDMEDPGTCTKDFDTRSLPSGSYFVRFVTGGVSSVKVLEVVR